MTRQDFFSKELALKATHYSSFHHFYQQHQDWLLAHREQAQMILAECVRASSQTPLYLSYVTGESSQLAAMMTQASVLKVFAAGVNQAAACDYLVDDLLRTNHQLTKLVGPAPAAQLLTASWARRCSGQWQPGQRHLFHRLSSLIDVPLAPGDLGQAKLDDAALIMNWQTSFFQEALPDENFSGCESLVADLLAKGDYFLWLNPQPVAMAAILRKLPDAAAIGMVYAPPEQRGQGYATTLTHALTRELLLEGWLQCWLFTNPINPTANHIYRKLGYQPDWELYEYRWFPGETLNR